jgi:hypothetical protein
MVVVPIKADDVVILLVLGRDVELDVVVLGLLGVVGVVGVVVGVELVEGVVVVRGVVVGEVEVRVEVPVSEVVVVSWRLNSASKSSLGLAEAQETMKIVMMAKRIDILHMDWLSMMGNG